MSSTMTSTLGTSNVRQSSRQTRTNPTRTSKTLGSTLRQNSLVNPSAVPPVTNNEAHGIYPAIQHFTDAITALPREYRRHTSLLKEVDAKAWGPEENLQKLLSACLASKPAQLPSTALPSAAASITEIPDVALQTSAANSVVGTQNDNLSLASLPTDPANYPRRKLFYDLRFTLNEMMVTMDEKNHVINNANEELARHLQRLNTIVPHLDAEISEEVRLGSSTHWAYAENRASAKALASGESRSRKEAAAGLAIMQNENVAARSESRREAVRENKRMKAAQQQQDSDFDDQRPAVKRTNVNGKAKRIGELAAEGSLGLGISNATGTTRKKRPEKSAAGGVAMERTTSGSNMGATTMSRQPSQQEGTKKRRAPKDATATISRKRYVCSGVLTGKADISTGRTRETLLRTPPCSLLRHSLVHSEKMYREVAQLHDHKHHVPARIRRRLRLLVQGLHRRRPINQLRTGFQPRRLRIFNKSEQLQGNLLQRSRLR